MKVITRIMIVLVLGMIILGTFMVFSASGTYSEYRFNDYYYLFQKHITKVVLAIGLMIIAALIDVDLYKFVSKYFMIGILIILIITLFTAESINGASRWFSVGPFSFQPSELAKLFLIVHIAVMFDKKGEDIKDFKNGFSYILFWTFSFAVAVVFQPNLSTAIIICFVAFAMMFVGGSKLSHLFNLAALGLIVAVILVLSFPHAKIRIEQYYNGLMGLAEPNAQVFQAKIGLGSGGINGVGFGMSRQSNLFLPESYTDFIFSILGEELGLIGALFLLISYLLLFILGVIISKKSASTYKQLLGFGISFHIVITSLINVAVVVGAFPTTGITLPFISYGGTSIFVYAVSIGMLINIAQSTYVTKFKQRERIE